MLTIDLCILGLAVASGVLLSVGVASRMLRSAAILVLLAAGLYGLGGLSVIHRLAWYTPERAKRIVYSEADKEKFAEGAIAARQAAGRFVPIFFIPLVVLGAVSFRRV